MHNSIITSSRKAFTLIELLTAIVIVATLMVMGLRLTKSLSKKQKQMTCIRQLSQVYITFRLYTAENRNLYPRSFFRVPYWQNWWGESPLSVYAGGKEIWEAMVICPENRTSTLAAPTGAKGYPYTANYNILRATAPADSSEYDQINVAALQNASKIILIIDSKNTNADWGIGFNSTSSGWSRVSAHHNGQANALWADGHVSSTALSQITDDQIIPK